jgi:hypothetical protein
MTNSRYPRPDPMLLVWAIGGLALAAALLIITLQL